ncbi:MAG TPA: lysophospholipid acyltransferase family protein [Candidatus Sulfobium mesophilum]|nr:lysophospholipid acyltransferase family protein [Candidatus Sulfobium mesophilum]
MIVDNDTYVTDPDRPRSFFSKIFLSAKISFYPQFFCIVWRSSGRAKRGVYGSREWAESSLDVMRALENVGIRIEITGMTNINKLEGPAVFIANHMSTLETMVLPCIIQPFKETTFIVKKSLLTTPVFGHVMRSRDPVVVSRLNAREDLKTVLEEGGKKLKAGRSIIVFPQSTRSVVFDPAEFNSLGIKLAVRIGVPVVPLALKTDAWGIGRHVKEFGPVDTTKKVHFAFGEPMKIEGRGNVEHEKVIRFIQERLEEWSREE